MPGTMLPGFPDTPSGPLKSKTSRFGTEAGRSYIRAIRYSFSNTADTQLRSVRWRW